MLSEEVGEVSEAILEEHFGNWGIDKYRTELIHVAAVAIAAVECLDQNQNGKDGDD